MAETKHLQALIDGCLKGDRKSQQALHKMFYGKMKALCMRYTRDNDQAMDVTQEGFVKVFTNLEKYTGVGSFEGWMRRIMVNLSIDRFRRLKHDFVLLGENQHLEDWEEEDEEEEEDEMDAIYDIRPEQIVDAMQQLSPAYRTVFNLYVYENYTHQDIAEALGISVGTSKSNYSKARRNMKKLLLKELKKKNEQSFKTV
ncbi:MAG: RNA polymerase sigma factor [Flavobacteriales bacterium]